VLGPRGMTWLSAGIWLLIWVTAFWPAAGKTAGPAIFASATWPGTVMAAAAQSPMEAQMLGERPTGSQPSHPQSYMKEIWPNWGQSGEQTTLQLPQNFHISFRYNSDKPETKVEGLVKAPLLFKYSMDYRLLPGLRVGLNGFLYQPPGDHLSFLRQKNDLVMGWGTSLNYDLGRWSFTFQSQVDQGRTEEGKDIQSWFRVWYAF
jgi:hypothetical protein